MNADSNYALVEIDIEEVKNDMVRSVILETAITVSAKNEYKPWFRAILSKMEK